MNKDHIRHEVMPWVYTFLAIVAAAVSLYDLKEGLSTAVTTWSIVMFLVCSVLAVGYGVNGYLATRQGN